MKNQTKNFSAKKINLSQSNKNLRGNKMKKFNFKKVYGISVEMAKKLISKTNFDSNSKLDAPDYSLSAYDCKTGGRLRNIKGSVCEKCYACKGNYTRYQTTQESYKRRKSIINKDIELIELWLPRLLKYYKKQYFRWHSSGDIQSLRHLQMIVNIAVSCPEIKFWLPTKEIKIIHKYLKNNTFPDNLIVRISNFMVGSNNFWSSKFLNHNNLQFSTVNFFGDYRKISINCPAYNKALKNKKLGTCGACKACWSKQIFNINYPIH